MAIQMRRGNEADLDIFRLLPGELAICIDTGKVIIKLSGGNYLTLTDSVALSALISGKSDASHSHDDRYYTEAEVDTLLSGKSDTGHTHNEASASAAGFMSSDEKSKLAGCKKVSALLRAEYDLLDPPDSDTVYLILEATS